MDYLMPSYNRFDRAFVKGAGSWLYDINQDAYLDFTSGVSVANLGHCHPQLVKTLIQQGSTLWHTSNNFHILNQEKLAQQLCSIAFEGKIFFCNSGAEANEAALKLARIIGNVKYGGKRRRILSFEGSFHGRSYLTLSVTGQSKIHEGCEPIADFIKHLPLNDRDAVSRELAKNDVAAIIIEPILGEGGVIKPDKTFLQFLRKSCDEHDTLLIFDEVQTGFGRTGTLFGFQHYGVQPDIMSLSKALGNGMPIGAILTKMEYGDYFAHGKHGSTFGGNPLACAVASEVVKLLTQAGFLEQVIEKGKLALELLRQLKSPLITDIRAMGLMIGIELSCSNRLLIEQCIKQKLLLIPAGSNTVRFYPPLTVSDEELKEGVERLRVALKELSLYL